MGTVFLRWFPAGELHRRLMELPSLRSSVHLTRGDWNVLRECAPAGP